MKINDFIQTLKTFPLLYLKENVWIKAKASEKTSVRQVKSKTEVWFHQETYGKNSLTVISIEHIFRRTDAHIHEVLFTALFSIIPGG